MQQGCCCKHRFENNIEPGGDPAQQRVGHTSQQCRLAVTQEFVEYQHLTARSQNPCNFGEAIGGFRHDGENQVQYRHVETGIGKRQALRVALNWREVHIRCAGQGTAQHGAIEVKADVMVLRRQVRQIESGADAGQQHAARRGGPGSQAALARHLRGVGNRRVVERGDQRIAVFQTQCSTRGMASVNSGMSASKCVPSSATIWYVPFMVPTGVLSDEPLEY